MVANLKETARADHGAGRFLRSPASGQGTFHRAPLFHDQPVPVRRGSALKLSGAVPRLVLRS